MFNISFMDRIEKGELNGPEGTQKTTKYHS